MQNVNKIPGGIADLLDEALKSGATVCLIPGKDIELDNWNSYLMKRNLPLFGTLDSVRQELSYFNAEDPIYTGVFESSPKNYKAALLHKTYPLRISNSQNFVSLFGTGTGKPFLLYSPQFNGRIVLMASPLDAQFTNFQNHALFAATFLRFAETASFQKPLYMTIGKEDNYPLNKEISEKNPVHLINSEFGTDVIPQLINTNSSRYISFSHLESILKNAGFYELSDNFSFTSTVALNFDRIESNTALFDSEGLIKNFEDIGWSSIEPLTVDESGIIEINQIKAAEYWRILLIFALIFIVTEIALLKFWKS